MVKEEETKIEGGVKTEKLEFKMVAPRVNKKKNPCRMKI